MLFVSRQPAYQWAHELVQLVVRPSPVH